MQTEKSQPSCQGIMPETRLTSGWDFSFHYLCLHRTMTRQKRILRQFDYSLETHTFANVAFIASLETRDSQIFSCLSDSFEFVHTCISRVQWLVGWLVVLSLTAL